MRRTESTFTIYYQPGGEIRVLNVGFAMTVRDLMADFKRREVPYEVYLDGEEFARWCPTIDCEALAV